MKTGFKNNKGFTLIELIVVMAVFLFIIGVAISIFIFVIKNQRRVLAEQEILSQISYAEEHMSKALRMATVDKSGSCLGEDYAGYNYLLTRPDGGFYTGIKFINQSYTDTPSGPPICQEFFFDAENRVLKELRDNNSDGYAVDLTSSRMQIVSVRFALDESGGSSSASSRIGISNSEEDQDIQPRVTILLQVKIPGDSQSAGNACNSAADCTADGVCDLSTNKCVATRTIQTTVSQRSLNIK